MKIIRLRFAIFCLVLFCIVCLPINSPFFNLHPREQTNYYFYTSKLNFEIKNAQIVSNGNASIVVCDAKESKNVKSQLTNIYGESVRISNYSQNTLMQIFDKYSSKVLKTETIDNYDIYLGYDDRMTSFVIVDDNKINFQIAITRDEINIGYPLILNGF